MITKKVNEYLLINFEELVIETLNTIAKFFF